MYMTNENKYTTQYWACLEIAAINVFPRKNVHMVMTFLTYPLKGVGLAGIQLLSSTIIIEDLQLGGQVMSRNYAQLF